jgi:hypothetical protein
MRGFWRYINLFIMNSNQLRTNVHNINKTLFWADYCKDKTDKEIREVERYAKFTFLKDSELQNTIQTVKNFNINCQ